MQEAALHRGSAFRIQPFLGTEPCCPYFLSLEISESTLVFALYGEDAHTLVCPGVKRGLSDKIFIHCCTYNLIS